MKSVEGFSQGAPEPAAACGTEVRRRLWRIQADGASGTARSGFSRDYACSPEDSGQRSVGNRKERLRDYASSPEDSGQRSVGNRKERLRDYASSPDLRPLHASPEN